MPVPSPIAAVAKSFAILSSHLDGESYTMRKCVLAVMREIVAKVLSRDDLDPLIWIRPIRPKMSSPGPMAPSKRRCTGNIAGLYFPVPGQDIDSVLPRVISLVDELQGSQAAKSDDYGMIPGQMISAPHHHTTP